VKRVHLDSKHALTCHGGQLDVASIAPVSRPRVLHVEVVGTVFLAVTSSKNGVVQISTTLSMIEDSRFVETNLDTGSIN